MVALGGDGVRDRVEPGAYLVACEELFHRGTLFGLDNEELGERGAQRLRVEARDLLVLAFHHFARQALHRLCLEGRTERAQLVQQAAERPYIALGVVRLIAPHLGRDVVGRAHLRRRERLIVLEHLGHAQVTQLEESVGA